MKNIFFAIGLSGLIATSFAQDAAKAPPPAPAAPRQAAKPRGLQAGAPVPPLQVAEWVKGEPIAQFEKGKVYLIEFWATWCGPCISNIPHLNALQKKYGKDGLVVIGFTSPDVKGLGGENGNTIEAVRKFVAQHGDRMNYHVAFDLPRREIFIAWFGTPNGGIPHAYLIDRDGNLVIVGHPFYMGDAIEAVIKGTWDPTTGRQQLARTGELYGAVSRTSRGNDYRAFNASFAELEREAPDMAKRSLGDFKIGWEIKEKDQPALHATVDEMIAYARENQDSGMLANAVNGALRGKSGAALPTGETLALLTRMADVALEICDGTEMTSLDAKAEVAFAAGDAKTAVAFGTKALEAASDPASKSYYQRRMDIYNGGS